MSDNRQDLLDRLDQSHDHFCRTVGGLTSAQWNFKATRERWSIFEVTEHLATVEDRTHRMLEQISVGPTLSPSDREGAAERDARMLARVADRARKQQAAETVTPMGRYATPADAITAVEEGRQRVHRLVETGERNLREFGSVHRLLGLLDGYEWILFLAAHMERHLEQMREIKHTPGFPEA